MTMSDTPTAPDLESVRLALQARLDAAKTATERNQLGQFATPTPLALDILRYAHDLFPADTPIRFLDPAIGTGAFFSALLATIPASRIARADGYEIDPHYATPARHFWARAPLRLHLADFTAMAPPSADERANLLICNPPYVRHHHLTPDEKRRLQAGTMRASGMRLSGLAGLYCYFLGLAHDWLADDGLAGWLIPSEFMDVNYGREVKRYLLDQVTLLRLHRFDPHEAQFDDALVSSAVVWFRKAPAPANHRVTVSYGGTLYTPKLVITVTREALRQLPKWTRLPTTSAADVPGVARPRLTDLFTIRRGLATGNNDFFVLTSEQIARYQLPAEFLRPILPSPRYLQADEILADPEGRPCLPRPLWLLDCRLPEAAVRARYPALWQYLQEGVARGVADTYLCRHRSPWYAQEHRPAAPLVCTYMGRQNTRSGRPFRFILNHSRATAANVYLLLYPTPRLTRKLQGDPDFLRVIWRWLNTVDPAALLAEGRVYGGGLHKLEPRELANLPVDALLSDLTLDQPMWMQPALFGMAG